MRCLIWFSLLRYVNVLMYACGMSVVASEVGISEGVYLFHLVERVWGWLVFAVLRTCTPFVEE